MSNFIEDFSEKVSLADNDLMIIADSQANNQNKKSKFSTLRNYLSTNSVSDISVSNFATEGYFNIARIPDSAAIKSGVFILHFVTTAGTKTEVILDVAIAHRLDNTGGIVTSLTATTAHSYNSNTTAENGYVVRYALLHYSSGYWYLGFYKYVASAITVKVINASNPAWEFWTQSVTAACTVGSFSRTVSLEVGFRATNSYADGSTYSAYSSYGVLGTYSRIRSNEDGANKWQRIGDIYMAYNASYQYGHSINVDLLFRELAPEHLFVPDELENFTINIKALLKTCLNGTAFNTAIPSRQIRITGNTHLTGNDVAIVITSSSASTKYMGIFIRTQAVRKLYDICALNRYGKSFTSSYTTTTSYCYFNYTGDQGFIASLPASAQGSPVFGLKQDGVRNIVLPFTDENLVLGKNNIVTGLTNEVMDDCCIVAGLDNTIESPLCLVNGRAVHIPVGSQFRRGFNNTDHYLSSFRTNCSQFQMSCFDYAFQGSDRQEFLLYHDSRNTVSTLRFLGYALVGLSLKVVCCIVKTEGNVSVVERAVGTINGWVDLANLEFKSDTRFRDIVFSNNLNGDSLSVLDTADLYVNILTASSFDLSIRLSGLDAYAQSFGFGDALKLDTDGFEIYFNVWVDAYELGTIPVGFTKLGDK